MFFATVALVKSLVLSGVSQPVTYTPITVVQQVQVGHDAPRASNVQLYRLGLVDNPNAGVLGVGRAGIDGMLEHQGVLWKVGSLDGHTPIAEPDTIPGDHEDFECVADTYAGHTPPEYFIDNLGPPSPTRMVAQLVIEADVETRNMFVSVDAEELYITTLLAITSRIYESDINTSFVVPLLHMWTAEPDPYVGANAFALNDSAWIHVNRDHPTITWDALQLIAGQHRTGQGLGYIGELCLPTPPFQNDAASVIPIDGTYSYPTLTTTWDSQVSAHELGHVFGAPHTQSCYWPNHGFCAANALLDSCVAKATDPYTGQSCSFSGATGHRPPDGGTIMSYCYQLAGGTSAGLLHFHPATARLIRVYAESCLVAAPIQPPTDLAVCQKLNAVHLTWNAQGADSGATLAYFKVFRSLFFYDANPTLVDSTYAFEWTGNVGTGVNYWSVSQVRNGSESPKTGYARADSCASTVGVDAALMKPIDKSLYDIQGRKVEDARNGVYFTRRGKKVVIR